MTEPSTTGPPPRRDGNEGHRHHTDRVRGGALDGSMSRIVQRPVEVRRHAAMHPSASADVHQLLAKDSAATVRAAVASVTTDRSVRQLLLNDPDPSVRLAALANQPARTLRRL